MKCPAFYPFISCLGHQSVYPFSISSIYPASWLLSICYLSVSPPTCLYIHPSIHLSIRWSTHPSIYRSINLFICLSIYYVSNHPSIDLSMYQSVYYLLIMYHPSKSWWTSSNTALSLKLLVTATIACKEKGESGVEWTPVFFTLSSLLKHTSCYPSFFIAYLLLSVYIVGKC